MIFGEMHTPLHWQSTYTLLLTTSTIAIYYLYTRLVDWLEFNGAFYILGLKGDTHFHFTAPRKG